MSQVLSCISTFGHDPRQWSKWRRCIIAFVIWNLIAPVELTLTCYSGIQQQIEEHFHTSEFIVTLGVGLFNLGSVFGPLIGGPLSEIYGRQPIYIAASVGFTLFSLATALSPTIFALLSCRTLAGLAGSAVFALYGGSLADLFNPDERGSIVALFTIILQGGPTFGPVPSSLLSTVVHWRSQMGFIAVWTAIISTMVICLPETQIDAIQRRIYKEKGLEIPKNICSPPLAVVWKKSILMPIEILLHEPIVTWTTLYHTFISGLFFVLVEAYPLVYNSHYSMSRQQVGLVFIAPWLGNLLGVLIYFHVLKPLYEARQHAIFIEFAGKREIPPEGRLPGVSVASLFTAIGMFWFALSARPGVHWLIPVSSGVPVGMGMTLLQLSLMNYYIDLYPSQSASVIAANCAVRGLVCTVIPSLGIPLYAYFGIQNAGLLLACLSCVGFPMAHILLFHGKRLRAASKWAKQDVADNADLDPAAPLVIVSSQTTYGGTDSHL